MLHELDLTRVQRRLEQLQPVERPLGQECSICLDPISMSAVGSCTHHYCLSCLLGTLASGVTACPECRTPICDVKRDHEFDALLAHTANAAEAATEGETERALQRFTRVLALPRGTHAGITLSKRAREGPGLVVSGLHRRDQAYRCGLRRGDVLVSVNGKPAQQPDECIDRINHLSRTSTDESVTLLVLPKLDAEAEEESDLAW